MTPKKRTRGPMRPRDHAGKPARLLPIGVIRSSIKKRSEAPKQASEGAPDAWLEVRPLVARALDGLKPGDEIVVGSYKALRTLKPEAQIKVDNSAPKKQDDQQS